MSRKITLMINFSVTIEAEEDVSMSDIMSDLNITSDNVDVINYSVESYDIEDSK